MKRIFNLLPVFMAILTIYSCNSNAEKAKEDTTATANEAEKLVIDTALVAGATNNELVEYEITKEDALGRLHAFQMTNPELSPGNPNYIAIPLNEFQVLTQYLDPDGAYAAFGKNGEELEIIFVGKPKNGGEEWMYFNFAKPCPPMCRDTIGISSSSN
jgi:hypothetical protein